LLLDNLLPAIKGALVSDYVEPQVHGILADAVDLYGIHAAITVRLKLATESDRTVESKGIRRILDSREEDILATLMLQKLATGGDVNIFHRLRAFRRSMQSLEDILAELNKHDREVKKKTDLQRLQAGRLPSRTRF
jgi:hypothetical protein